MLITSKIPPSYIFNKIKWDLLYVFLTAITVNYITHHFETHFPEMPLTIPAFIGTAISILLSFKLNQSYDRWWEARKIWGSIVNDSRSLIIQLQTLPFEIKKEIIDRIAFRQIAWAYVFGDALRGLQTLPTQQHLLSQKDINELQKQSNKALAIVQLNAYEIATLKSEGKIDSIAHVQIDNTLTRLVDSMGRAERIKSTVFPVTYRLFLHFMIYVFIVCLSISLTDIDAIFEIPLLMVIAATFFLLEKSATYMQDPFSNRPSDTAVTAIARTIEINIRELIGNQEVPEPVKPEKFYLK